MHLQQFEMSPTTPPSKFLSHGLHVSIFLPPSLPPLSLKL